MALNLDPIQVILQAFASGQQIKTQKEALEQRKVEHSERLEQEEKDRAEKIRQFDESNKYQQQRDKQMFDLQKTLRDIQMSQERRQLAGDIAGGKIPGKFSVPGNPIAEGLPTQFTVPSQKESVKFGDIELTPDQWQTPQEFYSQSPAMALERDLAESKNRNAMAVAAFNQAGRSAIADKQIEAQKEIAAGHDATRLDVGRMSARARLASAAVSAEAQEGARENRARREATNLIENYRRDKSYETISALATDAKIAAEALKDPKKLNGLQDVQAMYMFIRAQDPNRVSEGELALTKEGAQTYLEKVGISGYRFGTNNQVIFTPKARKQMLEIVLNKNMKRFSSYKKDREVFMNNLKLVNPAMANDIYVPNALSILKSNSDVEEMDHDEIVKRGGKAVK